MATFMFFSCVTEKGARRYLNEHELFAAQWCADQFPVTPSITIDSTADSTKYKEAYLKLVAFADSILRTRMLPLGHPGGVSQPARLTPAQADSIRQAIAIELEKSLKPCVDRVIKTVEVRPDSARIKALLLETKAANEGKQQYVDKYAAQVTKTNEEARAKRAWRMIAIGLLAAIGVGVLLLIRRR